MINDMTTVLEPVLCRTLWTPYIKDITERSLLYHGRFPCPLQRVSGTGKTTLAMHVAAR